MEVKGIIAEGRPLEPSESTRHKTYTWYKIGVHDGYDYALEEFENNRLKACDNQTPEEAERESAFVVPFVKKHHRTPTFSDAIEETRKQMIDKACKWLKSNIENYYYRDEAFDQLLASKNLSSDFIKAME